MNGSWAIVVAPEVPLNDEFHRVLPGVFVTGLAVPHSKETSGTQVLGISGYGSVGSTFLGTATDLQNWVDSHGMPGPSSLGEKLAGSIVAVLWDHLNQSIHVVPDPLGGAFVYVWRHGDLSVVTNDLNRMVGLAASFGVRLRKSLAYLLSSVVIGNGGFFPAAYEGVDVLPQETHLTINLLGLSSRPYARPSISDYAYSDQLDIVGRGIADNLRAAASAPARFRVSHLTGGFDSRLVLAGLDYVDRKDDFAFYCGGPDATPDRKVFDGLVRQFRLTPTRHPGFDTENEYASYEESTLANMNRMSGMLPNAPGLGLKAVPGGSIILSGGYGELLRSFFGARGKGLGNNDRQALFRQTWGSLGFGEQGQRLISAKLADELSARISNQLEVGAALGIREDALMDRLYLKVRNRYYVGLITASVGQSVPRIDPLYSHFAAYMGLGRSIEDRSSNFIGFDLMNTFSPGLQFFPFDTDRFTAHYKSVRGEPAVRSLPQRGDLAWDSHVPVSTGVAKAGLPRPSAADIAYANSIKASPAQIAGLPHVRSQLREMVDGIGRSVLSEHFDYVVLSRLLKSELKNRVHVRTCYSLYGSLLWYYRGGPVASN